MTTAPANPFEYAPAPESRAIVDVKPSYGLFIDGEFVDGSGEAFKTVNPATEEVLTEVSSGSEADVDRAVAAARRAFTRVWGPMRPADRGKYLFRIGPHTRVKARRAAATARSTSAALPLETSVRTSSVAGLTVLKASPEPSTNSPSMNSP